MITDLEHGEAKEEHTKMENKQLKKLKTPKTKRLELSISKKLEILKYAEVHTERETASKYGISKTAVNTMKKQRCELEKLYKANKAATEIRCRRVRNTKMTSINSKVWKWVKQANALNQLVTNKLIQQKACLLAQRDGVKNFSASNGWLESFKQLHGISIKNSSVEVQESNTLAQTLSARKMKEKTVKSAKDLSKNDAKDLIPSHFKRSPVFKLQNEFDHSLVLDNIGSRYLQELQI